MKILVDADACPVKDIIIKLAKRHDIDVLMVTDTSHVIKDDLCEVLVVEKGRDSVDFALINRTEKGDIVVSQDYGVAAMALSKKAYAINQNGRIYNKENIDMLLFERHISGKMRRQGNRGSKIHKRRKEDDESFEKSFERLCIRAKGSWDNENEI